MSYPDALQDKVAALQGALRDGQDEALAAYRTLWRSFLEQGGQVTGGAILNIVPQRAREVLELYISQAIHASIENRKLTWYRTTCIPSWPLTLLEAYGTFGSACSVSKFMRCIQKLARQGCS